MIKIITCSNGHNFDGEIYDSCPYCTRKVTNITPEDFEVDYNYAKLNTLKTELKEELTKNIDHSVKKLEEIIKVDSVIYNQLILLRSRLIENKNRSISGTLNESDIQLGNNKLRDSLLQLIDLITEEDIFLKNKSWKFRLKGRHNALEVSTRKDLIHKSDLIINFDKSPDGIPRLIKIKRTSMNFLGDQIKETGRAKITELIQEFDEKSKLLANIKNSIIDTNINPTDNLENQKQISYEEIIGNMMHQVMNLNSLKNIIQFTKLGNTYVSEKGINQIVPKTVLSQILGNKSFLNVIADKFLKTSLNTHAGYATKIGHNNTVTNLGQNEKYSKRLIFPLATNHVIVGNFKVKKLNETNFHRKELLSSYPFKEETLTNLNPKYKVVHSFNQEIITRGSVSNKGEYDKAIFTMLEKKNTTLVLEVTRNEVAKSFLTLCSELQKSHDLKIIHCDLSPKNIISLSNGFHPIDSLNVQSGNISYGLTPNFCAPEQILRQPVSPSTDIYNLGLMLLNLINGILFGKLEKFVFPTHDKDLEYAIFISNPNILIRKDSGIIENKGIEKWTKFLRKCLALKQSDRYSKITDSANDFEELINKFPLRGKIEFKPYFGGLTLIKEDEESVFIGRLIGDEDYNNSNKYNKTMIIED